ncbi:hypothetical protein HID58_086332, partial [Brassica napus]
MAWELEASSNEVEGQGDDPNPSGVKGKEGSRKNPLVMSCFPAVAEEDNDLEGETMEETKETKNIMEEGNREKDEAVDIRVTQYNFKQNHNTFTLHLLEGKLAKHLILPATRMKVKEMAQIHPKLRTTRVATNAHMSEVSKLSNRQSTSAS